MKLKKSIGKKTLLFLAINAFMGVDIFFLPAIGALYSGTASIIAWILMSVVALFISFYFAELVSMFPKAGGIYEYVKRSFGEFPSFILGWTAWIVSNIAIAMLVVGSLLYLFPSASFVFHLILSLFIIILFNYISYRGIDLSAKLLLFFGLMSVLTILAVIIPGMPGVDLSRFYPLYASTPMLLLTLYFISENFFGWEATTYLAEEVKDARTVLPKFIILATLIVSVIEIFFVLVLLGNVDTQVLSEQKAPLNYLVSKLFGSDFAKIFAVIIFIPMIGTAASWIVSSPRLLFAMARDRVLVPRLKSIHEKYRTPHYAILLQTVVTCFVTIIAIADYKMLLSLLLPLALIVYSVVLLSFLKLRVKMPGIKRYFKAPFGISGPSLIIVFNFILLLVWIEQVPGAIFIFIMSLMLVSFGIPIYLLIKLQTDEKFIEKFFDRFSWLWDRSFALWYGEREIKAVVDKLGIKNGYIVLDFGCGTGRTTIELAKRVVNGRVVAVDISKQQLKRAEHKAIEKHVSNVIFIKEHHLTPFEKHSFDAVTAVGVLDHLKDPERTLKNMFRLLKPGGCFSFFSFGKSMGIPAHDIMRSRERIKELFIKLGVKVNIKIEKKKMTEYIYMWGRK